MLTTTASNMGPERKRDSFFNILLHRPKTPQTIPSPSAPASTSAGQKTSNPLVPTSASHKQLGSNKLAAGIAPDTTLIPPKGASIPISSSVSSISQVETVQQTTPFSQQRIDRITLPPLIKSPHKNPRVIKAQEKLQKATEELKAEHSKYETKFPSHTLVKDGDITSPYSLPTEDVADFGKVAQQALSDHKVGESTTGRKATIFMEKVYPIASIVLGVVSFGADVAGLAPLKLTANALNVVVNEAAKQQTRSSRVIDCLNKLDSHQSFFGNINQRGYIQLSDNLLEVSTNLLAAIMGSLRVSLASLRTNFVVNMAKAVGGDDFADSQQALTTAMEALDRAIQQELLFDEKEREWKDECEKTLDFLSKIPANEMHADVRNRRLKDSGQWIIKNETFQKWMDGNLKTLWCPGKPGAGKTFLASVIIDHCLTVYYSSITENKSIGIAWMYFNYNDQDTNSMDQVMASLTKQLIASVAPEIGTSIMTDATDFRKKHKSGSPGPDDYFMVLSKVIGSMEKTVLILDALDECADTDSKGVNREWLINSLLKLGAQLLITSRDMPSIEALFEKAPDFDKLAISPASQDIKSYIKWRIYDMKYGSPNLRDLLKENQSLLEEIIQVVVEKYSEIFNLARLQVDTISELTTRGEVREALEALPMEESEFYHQAIKRIRNQKRHRDKAFRILAWTLCAKRPLSVGEMQLAAAIKPLEDFTLKKSDIVDFCGGLVLVNSESGTVAFAHLTINEYLKSASKDIFPTEPEQVIASTCLTYLSLPPFKSGSCPSDEEFETRLKENILLDYASRHWGQHAQSVQEQVHEEAFVFLLDGNLVSCCVQTMSVSTRSASGYKWRNYSQDFPKRTTGLHLTARFGLLYLSERLLLKPSGNIDIAANSKDEYSQTPLQYAAEAGQEAVVKLLLDHKAEVDSKDGYDQTPLSWAAQNGHEAVVKLLLEQMAEVDSKDEDSRTPLSWAAKNGHEAMVKLLLETGKAKVDSKNIKDGETPLSWAAEGGHEAVAKLLLEQKAKVDLKDTKYGRTPLSWAAQNGHEGVVKLLFETGKAEINVKDTKYGRTPLWQAARNGHKGVVKLLLEQMAEVDLKDKYGKTPLSLAAQIGHEAIVKLLLEQKAEVDSKDKDGWSPLSWAVENGDEAIVKLLLEHNAEVDSKDKDGWSPLSWAAENGDEAIVKLLLEHNAEVDSKDKIGRTPLSLATQKGHETIAKLLLEHKAKVSSKDPPLQ
ncbi:hypothetical protein V502_07220 [Pseudogymnoascus sp. VKM F-4520 (FW-2644)]|nr:hypothetical protein V502_07220 [Pseudogymnoascus sp. VKM F-4520 (FW-2644)]